MATSLTAESASLTVERYDRQGRLVELVEASGDEGNDNVTTSYDYDAANRLTEVSTPANGVTQVRTMTYATWETCSPRPTRRRTAT